MANQNTAPRLPHTGWLFVCLIVGTLIAGAYWAIGPVISRRDLLNIRGATQDEVLSILGPPGEIMHYGGWIYDRPWKSGWVAIRFDDDGRVAYINDEQAMPGLFGSGCWQR